MWICSGCSTHGMAPPSPYRKCSQKWISCCLDHRHAGALILHNEVIISTTFPRVFLDCANQCVCCVRAVCCVCDVRCVLCVRDVLCVMYSVQGTVHFVWCIVCRVQCMVCCGVWCDEVWCMVWCLCDVQSSVCVVCTQCAVCGV